MVVVFLIIQFFAITLTPLLRELIQFIEDLPTLVEDLDAQLQQLGEFYAQVQIPDAIRDWIDGLLASIGQEGGVGAGTIDFGCSCRSSPAPPA